MVSMINKKIIPHNSLLSRALDVYSEQDLSTYQGPVVQSIVSLTSSLRGQLVKCFTTL